MEVPFRCPLCAPRQEFPAQPSLFNENPTSDSQRPEELIRTDLAGDPPSRRCNSCGRRWPAGRGAQVIGSGGRSNRNPDTSLETPTDDADGRDHEDDAFLASLVELATEVTSDPARPDEGWDDDVEDLAVRLFKVWVSGSELAWARYAWTALSRAGLTSFVTELKRARVLVRLAALSALYQEFCARGLDEGWPGEWSVDDADLVGETPRIEPFVLGVLAERDGVDADIEVGYVFEEGSSTAYALRELVRAECRTVADALLNDMTPAVLFASLWASTEEDVGYPISDSTVSMTVNTDLTGEKLSAWQWIDDGMPNK